MEICRLHAGDFFGEEGLVEKRSRYTISTVKTLKCWMVTLREIYDEPMYKKILAGYNKYKFSCL